MLLPACGNCVCLFGKVEKSIYGLLIAKLGDVYFPPHCRVVLYQCQVV